MKKLLTLAMLLCATLGANSVLATQPEAQAKKEPKILVRVLDTSNNVARDIGGTAYSVSNKNLMLCWEASDMEFLPGTNNRVIETFTSPSADSLFIKPGATIRKVDNTIIINSKNAANDDGKFLQGCWAFDKADPLGKYGLTIQINDVMFNNLSFELVE